MSEGGSLMFKCPNCHKMFMQWDANERVLRCYGSRCNQVVRIPMRLYQGKPVPSNEDLQECINGFARCRKRARNR